MPDTTNLRSSSSLRTITSSYNADNYVRDNLGRATTIQNILGTFIGQQFTFHQSFANPLLQWESYDNRLSHRYLWSDSVDELLADEQFLAGMTAPNTKWALSDHQGTIKDIVDYNPATGVASVDRHRKYDPFGDLRGTALPTDIVFGYTGKYFDDMTGLQNNWNRWYDPKQGRFISQDPIGFAGGDENLYRYVGNDVTNSTDPSGLDDTWSQEIESAINGFLYWRAKNLEAREIEHQARVVRRQVIEHNAMIGKGPYDYSYLVLNESKVFGGSGNSGLSGQVMLVTTGMSKDQASLGLMKSYVTGLGFPIIQPDEYFLRSPDRWIFDTAVDKAFDPFTHTMVGGTGFQILRSGFARKFAYADQFVTRYRGTDVTPDSTAIMRGSLLSKSQMQGIEPSVFNRNLFRKMWHSKTSDTPPSQYVSVTRSEMVASSFGQVHEFKIRRGDLSHAWWNPFGEKEDLAVGGTTIINPIKR